MSAAFQKVIQAIGLYDHWVDVQSAISEDAEQWAQHAVQGILWAEAGGSFSAHTHIFCLSPPPKGCDRLAAIEETIVLAFTDAGGADNNRITTTLNRAYKVGFVLCCFICLKKLVRWRGKVNIRWQSPPF